MGEVYEVTHLQLRKKFALKILRLDVGEDPTFAARFKREMTTVSRLDHPNIVMATDGGAIDGHIWFSMTFVSGTDAQKALSKSPAGLEPARAVNIVENVASALDYAHRRDVLHRDVKPANILLATDSEFDEERVYLGDFGISKVVDESRPLTEDGQLLLTVDFASPEQIEGRALDARSDIYSLGGTFYTLLTGRVPFPAESFLAKANMHLQHQPPRPSSRVPGLPIGFDRVIARAMAKNPDDRYRTCRELATDARKALTENPSTDGPPAAPGPAGPRDTAESDTSRDVGTVPDTPTRLRPAGTSGSTPRPRSGRVRSFITIGSLVAIVAAVAVFVTIVRTGSTDTASNTPPTTSLTSSAAPADSGAASVASARLTQSAATAAGQPVRGAVTRPLSELLDPAVERRSGQVGGQTVANAAGYALTPKTCPTGSVTATAALAGGYQRITGNVGLSDDAPASTRATVAVVADGRELSRKVLSPTQGATWDLAVPGTSQLVIAIETLGQGSCESDGYFVFITDAVAVAA